MVMPKIHPEVDLLQQDIGFGYDQEKALGEDLNFLMLYTGVIGLEYYSWIINSLASRSCLDNILVFNIHSEEFSTIKFPPSVEVETEENSRLLMNFKGSLALVEYDKSNTRVWQMINDNWICHTMINLVFFPLGTNINDSKLWGYNPREGCLLLSDTAKRKTFKIEVSKAHVHFLQVLLFQV
ncbi:hypothetical protein IFM89_021821 [Coptis chinensis]|uniref:F-box associated beta-propeller type 3 domain-containing protein n=1 Tax=Coptis chinensis TaxID=261450 RepID=A0A835I239_9MAGN|nr:hypothetical protein IFM89_021821 [Coptis chinensis]